MPKAGPLNITSSLFSATRKKFSIILLLFLTATAIGAGFIVGNAGHVAGVYILGIVIGSSIVIICIANPNVGFYITILLAFFIYFLKRLLGDSIPLGSAMEILIWATFLGILLRRIITKEEIWAHADNAITYGYAFFTLYLLSELFNPNAHDFNGWFRIFRKFFESYLLYFIALYIFRNLKSVTFFFKFWLWLSLITALYACYQQWFGLPAFEYNWAVGDPSRYGLLFQFGTIRKFSFLSDPVGLGILMAMGSLSSFILAFAVKWSSLKKIMLIVGGIFMVLALNFSGIRTATAMIPTGFLIFGIMTIRNKKATILTALLGLFFLILIFGPFYNSGAIVSMRTAFSGSENASMNIRNVNRKHIQPFMHAHPFGGGLASSGDLGKEYNPLNPLAGFPPDSEFMQVALEIGWVGLAIILLIYFIVLKLCVDSYFRVRTQKIKAYYLATAAVIFALVIADLTQNATGQFTVTFIYYPLIAIVAKLRYFDPSYA